MTDAVKTAAQAAIARAREDAANARALRAARKAESAAKARAKARIGPGRHAQWHDRITTLLEVSHHYALAGEAEKAAQATRLFERASARWAAEASR